MEMNVPDRTNMSQNEADQAAASLEAIVKKNTEVLAVASLAFFFVAYKLILTRTEVIFEQRSGLAAAKIKSIDINDITNVYGSIGPIFGFIDFVHSSQDFPKQVGTFWRQDTLKMKRIIKGYMIALKQNADTNAIPAAKLVPMLYELGTDDKSITR